MIKLPLCICLLLALYVSLDCRQIKAYEKAMLFGWYIVVRSIFVLKLCIIKVIIYVTSFLTFGNWKRRKRYRC